jgi:hypothetical protein
LWLCLASASFRLCSLTAFLLIVLTLHWECLDSPPLAVVLPHTPACPLLLPSGHLLGSFSWVTQSLSSMYLSCNVENSFILHLLLGLSLPFWFAGFPFFVWDVQDAFLCIWQPALSM